MGLSPRGCKASDTTEWPTHHALVNTYPIPGASEAALAVRSPSANAGGPRDAGAILGQEDALEEEVATHASILA